MWERHSRGPAQIRVLVYEREEGRSGEGMTVPSCPPPHTFPHATLPRLDWNKRRGAGASVQCKAADDCFFYVQAYTSTGKCNSIIYASPMHSSCFHVPRGVL